MKIGIIGAMEEEVTYIKEKLNNIEETTIAGCEFFSGMIGNKEIVLLKSGIGKVNAAIGTTLLNHLFKPDYVINTGVAGGLLKELEVGQIVISTEVRYHDVDATIFGYEFGQVPQMPAAYEPDVSLIEIAENAAKHIGVPSTKGLIVSGDSFMSDGERVEHVKSTFNRPYCVEMEAGAIAQVCHQFNVPFVIIRALSDVAGRDAKVTYEQFLKTAAVHSAKQVLLMVEQIS